MCESIALLAQTAHQLKHHVYHMYCNAQQKVRIKNINSIDFYLVFQAASLQNANPTAEITELISAICGYGNWLQEVFECLSKNETVCFVFFLVIRSIRSNNTSS